MPFFLNSFWICCFLSLTLARVCLLTLPFFTSWRYPILYRASNILRQQWSGLIHKSWKHHKASIDVENSFLGFPFSKKSAGKRWQKLHLWDAGFPVSWFRILPSIILNFAVTLIVMLSSHWYGSTVLKSCLRRFISSSITSEKQDFSLNDERSELQIFTY